MAPADRTPEAAAAVVASSPPGCPGRSASTPNASQKTTLASRLRQLPAELRERRQWICWTYEARGGKPTKVPYAAATGRAASTIAPADWTSFDAALAAYANGTYDGVGYVFVRGDGVVGVDLDKCLDPTTRAPVAWAEDAIRRLNSYTEVSPSQRGVHVLAKGQLPAKGRRRGSIEMYETERYFAMTGDHLPGTPRSIEARATELLEFHRTVFQSRPTATNVPPGAPRRATDATDTALLQRARSARNGAAFRRLYDDGDITGYESHSEADLALCGHLRFWTGGDAARIDRLFRSSALHRPKWDEARGASTYGEVTIATACAGSVRSADNAPRSAPPGYAGDECTDMGNARRFVRVGAGTARHCRALGWLVYDGVRWREEAEKAAMVIAKRTARSVLKEADACAGTPRAVFLTKHWHRVQSAARLEAMLRLAAAEPEIDVAVADLDSDLLLLNMANGTLELDSGVFRPHRAEDLITKVAGAGWDPQATCPAWNRFTERVLPDPEVRAFVQRLLGSSLSGLTSDQVLVVLHGAGANGKTVLTESVSLALGDYGTVTPFETLTARRDSATAASPDLADLVGSRLVLATEPAEGARLNIALLKQLTGGDRIKTRKVYGQPFVYSPQFKLLLVGNHRPHIPENTHAAWRRLLLVPFEVVIPDAERDPHLREKLRLEVDGILQWLYVGWRAWRDGGLAAPAAVRAATESYRAEENTVARFIGELCVLGKIYSAKATPLYHAYRAWASAANEPAITQRAFGDRLGELGLENRKSGTTTWFGIGLRQTDPDDPDSSRGIS